MADAFFLSTPHPFTQPPPIVDDLTTETSSAQQDCVVECLPYLKGTEESFRSPFDLNKHGVPRLDRQGHINFLHQSLEQFPAAFVTIDASRPWMVYWALMGLYLLGGDVTQYRKSVIKTFAPIQNASGGFGGGHGQYSHLAGTYAAILSLALVGGEEAYSLVNRESMWKWLGRLRRPSGGFEVCEGGEEDVRGAYCAMVVISLLNLPIHMPEPIHTKNGVLRTFHHGLQDYLSKCQTFEGGISGAPGNEAHGAYAFCALACLCLINRPATAFQCLDLPSLVSWLSSRQYAPEGGFAGRTNKLVDGCYSFWVGGCWPLIQASLNDRGSPPELFVDTPTTTFYSKEGLTRYILSCCQAPAGGLRDKPSKRADSYHTCYALAGLSSVQHIHRFLHADAMSPDSTSPFWWTCEPWCDVPGNSARRVFDQEDTLQPFHPLFVIPHEAAHKLREWAEGQNGNWSVDLQI